jgi:hypothetical protein
MPVWRLQCTWQVDSVAPRDRMMITPHFNDIGATTDPQNLCDDMLAGLQAITPSTGEVRVTAYDAQGSIPVYPQGDAIVLKGAQMATNIPRELALCLSFYSERNVPRQRGRLFLPLWFLGIAGSGLRPTLPVAKMASLVNLFTGLGGPDVDWCVYSRVTDAARSVTNWWVDNEWDVQRSRGLTGTSRTLGTTTEQGDAAVQVPLAVP